VERKHRHIVDIGLTLLACSKLPMHFWGYVFTTAVSIINVLPTPVLNNQSPSHTLIMFFTKPLDVLVILCFAHIINIK